MLLLTWGCMRERIVFSPTANTSFMREKCLCYSCNGDGIGIGYLSPHSSLPFLLLSLFRFTIRSNLQPPIGVSSTKQNQNNTKGTPPKRMRFKHDLVNEIRLFGSNLIEVRASDLSEALKLVSGAEVEVLSAESGEDYQRLQSFLQTRRGNQLMT